MLPLLGDRARWESAESAIPRSGSARRTASMASRVRSSESGHRCEYVF